MWKSTLYTRCASPPTVVSVDDVARKAFSSRNEEVVVVCFLVSVDIGGAEADVDVDDNDDLAGAVLLLEGMMPYAGQEE